MKQKTIFRCKNCGHTEPRWLGRCPECGNWNTFIEERVTTGKRGTGSGGNIGNKEENAISIPLSSIKNEGKIRISSRIKEVDTTLGGGIIKGSAILLGGEPGIGKSTLMLQLASNIETKRRVLYISGEESPGQIKMRSERLELSPENVEVLSETELSSIINVLNNLKPIVIIVDSIQTLYAGEIESAPGNVNQIKYCTQKLIEWVKQRDVILFLVAHVTKEGVIAGPKVAEHMVDTVLYFDRGEGGIRFLRVTKNRFGSTDEIGIFKMTRKGLVEVKNPESLFLFHRRGEFPPGVAMAVVYEGTRTLLVEIQSLVVPAKAGISRVFSDTIDPRRISRIAAVLEKTLKLKMPNMDLYVNVAGGLRVGEVGIELPLALSIYSARMNTPLPENWGFAGEISLSGEVRPIGHIDRRIKAAEEMHLKKIVIPAIGNAIGNTEEKTSPIFIPVSNIREAVKTSFKAS